MRIQIGMNSRSSSSTFPSPHFFFSHSEMIGECVFVMRFFFGLKKKKKKKVKSSRSSDWMKLTFIMISFINEATIKSLKKERENPLVVHPFLGSGGKNNVPFLFSWSLFFQ